MAISKSIVGCDANDLRQFFSLGQEATETSPFLHTLNSIADIISFVPENISPCKYYDLTLSEHPLTFVNVDFLYLIALAPYMDNLYASL